MLKGVKYQYGYLDLLLFITECISNISINKTISYTDGLSCKLVYTNDTYSRDGQIYPKAFGYQHDSVEFVLSILTTFSNISDMDKLFGFNEIITKNYFNITYDIVYTYAENIDDTNIANRVLNHSVTDRSLNNVFYNIIDKYANDINLYNNISSNKEFIIENQYFTELKIVRKKINAPPEKISVIDHMFVITDDDNKDLISILNSFTYLTYSEIRAVSVKDKLATIYNITSSSIKKLKKTAKYLLIAPKGLNKVITKTTVKITNELIYDNKPFSLVGYIYHEGSLVQGHYQTVVLIDNIFYNCSDRSINPVDIIDNTISDVCMLLYENKSDINQTVNLKPNIKIHNLKKFLNPFSEKISSYLNS